MRLCRNNRETVYSLLGSHGDTENLVYLAEALHDTEKLIQYNLRYDPFTTYSYSYRTVPYVRTYFNNQVPPTVSRYRYLP